MLEFISWFHFQIFFINWFGNFVVELCIKDQTCVESIKSPDGFDVLPMRIIPMLKPPFFNQLAAIIYVIKFLEVMTSGNNYISTVKWAISFRVIKQFLKTKRQNWIAYNLFSFDHVQVVLNLHGHS